jgi:hypothetical protein
MRHKLILMAAMVAALSMSAQTPAAKSTDQPKVTKSKSAAATAPTAAEIADAKSKGMVWVNTKSKVYHKEGPSYGTTKNGKFMTEADAEKAGYKAAKEPVAKKSKTTVSK